MEALRKQGRDMPQFPHWSFAGEDPGSGIGPAHDVRLCDSGLDLVQSDHPKVLDRSPGRLRYGNEPRDAATSPLIAWGGVRRLGDGTGEHPADLEKASGSR